MRAGSHAEFFLSIYELAIKIIDYRVKKSLSEKSQKGFL
jgi:hypothetical protein